MQNYHSWLCPATSAFALNLYGQVISIEVSIETISAPKWMVCHNRPYKLVLLTFRTLSLQSGKRLEAEPRLAQA